MFAACRSFRFKLRGYNLRCRIARDLRDRETQENNCDCRSSAFPSVCSVMHGRICSSSINSATVVSTTRLNPTSQMTGYIELPPTATNIVLFRNGAGHFARFTNPTDSLESWVTQMRAQRPELNSDSEEVRSTPNWPKEMRADMLQLKSDIFANRFRDSGWSYDPNMIEFQVLRSRRGGGYSIWHLRETGDTYLSAGYW